MDKNFADAINEVRSDPASAKQFVQDPKGYLASKGVDTSGLKVGAPAEAAGAVSAADASACVSVGCVICGTVGL